MPPKRSKKASKSSSNSATAASTVSSVADTEEPISPFQTEESIRSLPAQKEDSIRSHPPPSPRNTDRDKDKDKDKEKDEDQDRIHVYLRIRPTNSKERNEEMLVSSLRDPKVVHLTSGKQYGYDAVLYDDTTQERMFNVAVLPTLTSVFEGYTAAVLAYGQTGTGKTFTMRGTPSEPGIIPRVADYIFRQAAQDIENTYRVHISYIQLYLDKPRDLLENEPKVEVIVGCSGDHVQFVNLKRVEVHSTKELMTYVDAGDKNKVVRCTVMNADSSRGHSALVVDLDVLPKDQMKARRHGKLFLVDLAGYEQAAVIGQGSMELMMETKHINETLLALNRVICALARRDSRIPYREYKLTMMLKEALGLKCRSCIILNIGPCEKYKQQTYNTLYFGKSAMTVEVKATVEEIHDYKKYAALLMEKLAAANEQIQTLLVWFKKQAPKEFEKYENVYGQQMIDSSTIDEILRMIPVDSDIAATVRIMEEEEEEKEEAEDEDVQTALVRLHSKCIRKAKIEEDLFEKELEQLKRRQWKEVSELVSKGADPEEVLRLKKEHEFELSQRQKMEEEHRALQVEAQVAAERGAIMSQRRRAATAHPSIAAGGSEDVDIPKSPRRAWLGWQKSLISNPRRNSTLEHQTSNDSVDLEALRRSASNYETASRAVSWDDWNTNGQAKEANHTNQTQTPDIIPTVESTIIESRDITIEVTKVPDATTNFDTQTTSTEYTSNQTKPKGTLVNNDDWVWPCGLKYKNVAGRTISPNLRPVTPRGASPGLVINENQLESQIAQLIEENRTTQRTIAQLANQLALQQQLHTPPRTPRPLETEYVNVTRSVSPMLATNQPVVEACDDDLCSACREDVHSSPVVPAISPNWIGWSTPIPPPSIPPLLTVPQHSWVALSPR